MGVRQRPSEKRWSFFKISVRKKKYGATQSKTVFVYDVCEREVQGTEGDSGRMLCALGVYWAGDAAFTLVCW